jgi:hypothetical protein
LDKKKAFFREHLLSLNSQEKVGKRPTRTATQMHKNKICKKKIPKGMKPTRTATQMHKI